MRALASPFVEPVVTGERREKAPQGWAVPIQKLFEMGLARRLEQNEKTGGFAERDFGVFHAASGPTVEHFGVFTLIGQRQILVVKLRVDERGDMVEQGVPPVGIGCQIPISSAIGTQGAPPFVQGHARQGLIRDFRLK